MSKANFMYIKTISISRDSLKNKNFKSKKLVGVSDSKDERLRAEDIATLLKNAI